MLRQNIVSCIKVKNVRNSYQSHMYIVGGNLTTLWGTCSYIKSDVCTKLNCMDNMYEVYIKMTEKDIDQIHTKF
jgi:hypothetical protein